VREASLEANKTQIEYMVVSFDDEKKRALLSLRQTEILKKLQRVTMDPALQDLKPRQWYDISYFSSISAVAFPFSPIERPSGLPRPPHPSSLESQTD
jgi:hypothetical protein